jgi:biopolymer transport protein ExbB
MKKVFAILSIVAMFSYVIPMSVFAQDEHESAVVERVEAVVEETYTEVVAEGGGFHKALKQKYIEGTATWMTPIALCLILGLALCIERIIYLSLSSTNTNKLLAKVDEAWEKDGVSAALEVCRNTRGPVASIFYQGLYREKDGIEVVEKTISSAGASQLGLMEKNLTWISLFIAIVPSIGFLGTVVGMVMAFDDIQQAGDISPTVVAGGMKLALITTIFALIVAVILQIFFNYIITLIEALTSDMEDASISLLDVIMKHSKK